MILQSRHVTNGYGRRCGMSRRRSGISSPFLLHLNCSCFLHSKSSFSGRRGVGPWHAFTNYFSRSTDFEVHRNWLAITHSLPISQWYYDVCVALYSTRMIITYVSCVIKRQLQNGVSAFEVIPDCFSLSRTSSALDYPPFFAYFEKVLSIPAYFIDPRIVDLNNLNYSAWSVIAYQRTTVILTELVLAAVLLK
jgi:ALG6, ALG8 glycosyltransferase family